MVDPANSPGHTARTVFAAVAATVFWFALLLQFSLTRGLAAANGAGTLRAIAIFLAYFTILSNLVAAIALATPLLTPRAAAARFFARPGPISAIAAYMLLVGIAYNLLLRGIWNPQGWQLLADNLLHVVDPLLFAGYWWIAGRSRALLYRSLAAWMLYPIAYFVYAVVRGLSGDFYAYPFIDVAQLGLVRVVVNALAVAFGFLAIAASLIALGRRSSP